MPIRTSLSAALLTTLLLTGCAPQDVAGPVDEPVGDPVTILRTPFLGDGALAIAIANGWFEEAGIAIETVEGTSGQLFGSIVAGDIDVAYAGTTPALFRAAAEGSPVRAVAGAAVYAADACPLAAIVGTPEAAARIAAGVATEPEPLRLGGSFRGLGSRRLLEAALESWGVADDPGSIEIVPTDDADLITLMRSGQLDLALAFEPNLTLLQRQAGAVVVANAGTLVPDERSSMIVFSARLLEDRELGARILAVYLRAEEAYSEGATEENVAVLAATTGIEPDLLRAMCWATLDSDGRAAAPFVESAQRTALESGDIDELVAEADLWDHTFRDRALELLTAE